MSVDTLEEHSLSIDQEKRIPDLDVAESVLGTECHFILSISILLHNSDCV